MHIYFSSGTQRAITDSHNEELMQKKRKKNFWAKEQTHKPSHTKSFKKYNSFKENKGKESHKATWIGHKSLSTVATLHC